MTSIPQFDVMKEYFSSEDLAVEYLVKKFNTYSLNSHFSNEDDSFDTRDQPESEHPDTKVADSGVLVRHQSDLENAYSNPNHHNIQSNAENTNDTTKADKGFDNAPAATNKLETSTKVIMYHALNLTESITFKQNLAQRSKLPCHLLLYVTHLWLANCSKDSIALLVGVELQVIQEWIGYCTRTICDKVEKDIDFLPPEERILIAERMWRRKYKERLWDALLEIAFQPILHARNMTKGDNVIIKEPEDILASFESMGLKENLLDGIVAYGISEPSEVRQVRLIDTGIAVSILT
jgi:hypothetical protein